MFRNRLFLLGVCSLLLVCPAMAQEKDLLAGIDTGNETRQWATAAFKSTRVINAHSMEMLAKGSLDLRILHRFGLVNNGIEDMFGLDQASMRLGVDYGISDRLMVGVGRSTYRKELDVFVKTRLIRQAEGKGGSPISLLVAAGGMTRTERVFVTPKPGFDERSAAFLQVIAGRKFSEKWSLQLSPILLYTGTAFNSAGDQFMVALGAGTRFKVSKRVALTLDYHHPLAEMDSAFTVPMSVGVDIETGGHVFQLHLSNSVGMNERAFLTETTGRFFKGDLRFGFNLSRIFQVGRRTAKKPY